MKKKTFTIILTLLLLSSLPVLGIQQSSHSPVGTVKAMPSVPNVMGTDVVDTYDNDMGIVIFAKDKSELQTLAQLPGVYRVYNNLQAVRLLGSHMSYKLLTQIYPTQTFTAKAIDSVKFIDPVPVEHSIEQEAGLALDATKDAEFMGVKQLWDQGYFGQGVTVAVFDNGVDFSHPALDDRKAGELVISNSFNPCRDHGTPVAGTIAATEGTLGNAYGSKIYDIAFGCDNNDNLVGDVLLGFNEILAQNETIDIVNTSWGPESNGGIPYDWITSRLEDVGIILTGSAGNNGPGDFTTFTGSPGNSIHAISAGGVSYTNEKAFFSSMGPSYKMISKPDIVAPGLNVNTTRLLSEFGSLYGPISGTSFSSPLTAGALATLISALRSRGISYNVGLLKAALLAGATDLGDDYEFGQGIPNIAQSLSLIESASTGTGGIRELVELTPQTSVPKYIAEVPKGVVVKVPLTLISSLPGEVTFSKGGDLSSATVDSPTPDSYSQIVNVYIDTSSASVGGEITGTITAKLGTSEATSTITLSITNEKVATIGVDIRHTYWDETVGDTFGGTNTGEMIQLAIQNGYWIEEFDSVITPSLLDNYDILWMPDPLNLDNQQTELIGGETVTLIDEKPLLQSEIDAIVDYVDSGGNLLVDFNGYYLDGEDPVGLNATGMNKLISHFGITANEQAISPIGGQSATTLKVYNVSSITKGVRLNSHFGGYLDISGAATALTRPVIGGSEVAGTAIYSNPDSGGRVLVSATNFWLDNSGITGQYGAGGDDKTLALNMLQWFTQDQQLIELERVVTDTTISGKFKLLDNGIPSSTTPSAVIKQTATIEGGNVGLTDEGNGVYSFTIDIVNDGDWQVIVTYGDEYLLFSKIIDTTGPSITASDDNQNMTIYPSKDDLPNLFAFIIDDAVSEVIGLSINFTLDGEQFDTFSAYERSEKTFRIIINPSHFTKDLGLRYTITISASDSRDNFSSVNYIFWIGDPIDITTTTTTTTTSTSNSTDSETDENGLPLITLPVIILVLITIPVVRKRKSIEKQANT